MLVDFMIIGAQKSGTTTLANQLAAHPAICFCAEKEPGYFNRMVDWRSGLAGYHALYTPQPGQLLGEASTMYTFLPEFTDTHLRLHEYNPALKFIYMMRNPIERIVSNYGHRLVRSTEDEAPDVVVFRDPEYINRSRYGVQLRPYVETFGRDRLLLLAFEEYIADPAMTLGQIAAFLEIDPAGFALSSATSQATNASVGDTHLSPTLTRVREMAGVDVLLTAVPSSVRQRARALVGKRLQAKPDFSPELRKLLWRFLEDDVRTVEGYMGRQMDHWRKEFPV